jgi:hypothetical protein
MLRQTSVASASSDIFIVFTNCFFTEVACRGANRCKPALPASWSPHLPLHPMIPFHVIGQSLMAANDTLAGRLVPTVKAAALAAAVATALAACAEVGKTSQAAPMAAAPTAPAAPTTQQARAECWMKFEGDKRAPKDLDLRVKLVEKCVDDKLAAPKQ